MDERCLPLLAEINRSALHLRTQLPAMTVPAPHRGWLTSVNSSLDDLEEGTRTASAGQQSKRQQEVHRGDNLIIRAARTLSNASTSPPPVPATASEAAKTFWTLQDFVLIEDRGQCPGYLWSLTKSQPGEDEFERRNDIARAPNLRRSIEGKTYVVRLEKNARVDEFPEDTPLTLGEYDFGNMEFPLTVQMDLGCTDDPIGVGISLMGLREKDVTYKLHVPPDDAKSLRSSWHHTPVYFDIAVQPRVRPTPGDVVEFEVKAVRLFTNKQPLLAVVDEAARPWEAARQKRRKH